MLWEHEVDAQSIGEPQWQRATTRGFDAPPMFSAYLHALRWNAVTATDPRLFQAPHRAGIQVMAYQLEPLRKALLLPRVNLFIADDVGLGKTIEAGLIQRARRPGGPRCLTLVYVATPYRFGGSMILAFGAAGLALGAVGLGRSLQAVRPTRTSAIRAARFI